MNLLNRLKKVLKNNFASFFFFYGFLRHRIFVTLLFSLFVGTLDGFGLAMFLPLLQMVDGNHTAGNYNSEGMGNLSFLVEGMKYTGMPLTLTTVLLVMLVFFLLKGFFRFAEGFNRVINQRYFIKSLRFSNIDLLSNYSYKSFVLSDSGRIQNTFSGEVERVVTAYRSYFSAIQFGVLVAVYVVLAFLANAQFAILVGIGAALTNLIYKRIYKTTKKISRQLTKENHAFQGLLIQKVAFFKYLKATGYLITYGKKLKLKILSIEKQARKMGLLSSALQALREPVVVSVVICVILFQVNIMGQQLGLIILSLLFFYRSLAFLMAVQNHWNTYLGVSGSLDNMVEFSKELKQGGDVQGKEIFCGLKQCIKVEHVDFFYQNTQILNDISFEISKNETVAFVGESGSGKTTMMNLLSGLMLPDKGDITIDTHSVRSLDRNSFQRKLGYITQDPVIFNDTVFNNVTLWASPTQENIKRFCDVLKQAAIYDFIMALPDKEQALLGNNGIMVSGGQKQRLSIARELFKDVEFLFLDEATSALDSETERAIQGNIESLKGKYTIIIIAHRLSTVKNADKIILLSKGRIEAVSSFEVLMQTSPMFKRMVELQEFEKNTPDLALENKGSSI
jgi:ABC-type multidrug transport system fused ATPase/permease subunit